MIGQPPNPVFRMLLPNLTNQQGDSDMNAVLSQLLDLLHLVRYFAFVAIEGDWLNDNLTHVPATWQATVMEIGKVVAQVFEAVPYQ